MAGFHYAGWYVGDPDEFPDPYLERLLASAREYADALWAEEADLRGEVA